MRSNGGFQVFPPSIRPYRGLANSARYLFPSASDVSFFSVHCVIDAA